MRLVSKDGGHCQTDHCGRQTVAHLAGSHQGAGPIASLLAAGADDLLVALIVGGEAGILGLLRNPAAVPLDPVLVVHLELDHGLPAEGLLAHGRHTVLQVLLVPLGARRVHHQAGAVFVLVRIALMAPNGTHWKKMRGMLFKIIKI